MEKNKTSKLIFTQSGVEANIVRGSKAKNDPFIDEELVIDGNGDEVKISSNLHRMSITTLKSGQQSYTDETAKLIAEGFRMSRNNATVEGLSSRMSKALQALGASFRTKPVLKCVYNLDRLDLVMLWDTDGNSKLSMVRQVSEDQLARKEEPSAPSISDTIQSVDNGSTQETTTENLNPNN